MGFEISIPTRNAALEAVATLHSGHVIRVFDCSGSIPTSPSAAWSGFTLLGIFTESDDGSTGLTMEASATNGVLEKNSGELWQSTVIADGTAEWYVMSSISDTGGSSTTEPRVTGTVGVVNADLLFSSVDWSIDDEKRIDTYVWGQPEDAS